MIASLFAPERPAEGQGLPHAEGSGDSSARSHIFMMHSSSPRQLIARLGLAITCLTALVPPVGYALINFSQLEQRALEQAAVGARHVEAQLLPKRGVPDGLQQVAINVVNATSGNNAPVSASWVTDTNGFVLTFMGSQTAWPEVRAQSAIRSDGAPVGHFNAAISSRELFIGTASIAAAFLLLALAAHYCFTRLPLAALDRALRLVEKKQEALIAHQTQVETQNMRFEAALNNMSQALCMFDKDQRLIMCNERYAQMYGLTSEHVRVGTTLQQIVEARIKNGIYAEGDPDSYLRERIAPVQHASYKIQQLSDGRSVAISRSPMRDGGWVTTHEDITAQREKEDRIAYLAKHDMLTGLPNRVLFKERLEASFKHLKDGQQLAIMCFDLDRFKAVNDTLGHSVGDELLRSVAMRVRECLRERDVAARIGGDEFSIIQYGANQPEDAIAVASRLVGVLGEPYMLGDHHVSIGASVGISLAPNDGTEPELVLRNADLALYRAKQEGKGQFRLFEPAMDKKMRDRREIEIDLRRAFDQREFELYYQPFVRLSDDRICGFEALMRWFSPTRGPISPAEFIPIAEEMGLIEALGEWALREACQEAARWPSSIRVAVNISARQLMSPKLCSIVVSALEESGLSAERLELEVTESVLMKESSNAIEVLRQIRNLGVHISMDDFGTGYSSLSHLKQFPFDRIKLDRSFVHEIGESGDAAAIVRAVANLGQSLRMLTTAEGIETTDQLDRVRAEGYTEVQGYLISKPVPAQQARELALGEAAREMLAALRAGETDLGDGETEEFRIAS